MTLKVDPEALRAHAARLAAARHHAEVARNYVIRHGSFSFHETGLIGYLFPHHTNYVEALTKMLDHLTLIADASETSMRAIATNYERTDQRSANAIDANYPVIMRPSPKIEPNYPPPSPW